MDEKATTKPPRASIICSGSDLIHHCQTLENSTQVLELLQYLDLSEGITKNAEFGLFLVLETLIESLQHVSSELKNRHRA